MCGVRTMPPSAQRSCPNNALAALEGRTACLLANHGLIATGANLNKAMWAAVELETIARQYYHALVLGSPVILSDAAIEDTHKSFATYGLQEVSKKAAAKKRK